MTNQLQHRDDGDVMPEAVPYLRYPADAAVIPGAGWTTREPESTDLVPDTGHSERVIVWIAAVTTVYVVAITALWWALKWGWMR